MTFVLGLLIQLVVLVIAMVIAGLIMRWIISHPAQGKAVLKKGRRSLAAPRLRFRAFRTYNNWKKVGMGFSYSECLAKEWEEYDEKHNPRKEYYRM